MDDLGFSGFFALPSSALVLFTGVLSFHGGKMTSKSSRLPSLLVRQLQEKKKKFFSTSHSFLIVLANIGDGDIRPVFGSHFPS